ncbi:laminin subunit beta-4 isoform X1 [Synchiropus splendidus]|uniref:laminin subunit beta-4 isoform X1 n=1 Tax=Synchiropus splendidus TaxID=270530 RepID=UPI00237D6609|nr:laminin subunit beta-4 isoform X1 [Synchiropus splendidus]
MLFILLFLSLLPEVFPQNQPGTPQLGDLMVGRATGLSASSTCGLRGPEDYCIIGYLQEQQKCFTCDSRLPYSHHDNHDSHRVENIITSFDPEPKRKWWQSENGVHEVSIQLDLESRFQLSHLILTFKSFRPAAMLVESSKDFGRTWNVLRYFAEDCLLHFPSASDRPAERLDDVVCDSRYSGSEPSTGGQVVLKILDPVFGVEDPHAPHIQAWTTMTNIRVNFTRLFTLGDTLLGRKRRDPWSQNKYFYALYNMAVHGRCFCNGHADYCVSREGEPGDWTPPDMVHGRCVCLHDTAGEHCERCAEFHNDAPWRPGGEQGTDVCRRCDCNGLSESCHFDVALFEATGRGGVCDNCRNGRTGTRCELCGPLTYQDPQKSPEDPSACIPCDCSSVGSLGYGQCDPRTGHCACKENVEGQRCERCKHGFFGLSQDDEAGCRRCMCHVMGSVGACDQLTGSCECEAMAIGPLCDRCRAGFWGLGNSGYRCSPCDCDAGGAYSDMCSSDDGQCQCLPNMGGRRCDEPAPGYYLPSLDYFLYEAELGSPVDTGTPPSSPLTTTGLLPECEQYFRQQGYEFKFSNGRVVLVRRSRRHSRRRRQVRSSFESNKKRNLTAFYWPFQWSNIPHNSGHPLQIIPRQRTGDGPVTWTGVGLVRVLDGAGLRITVDNLPQSMDYQLVIRYETEDPSDWLASVSIVTQSAGSGDCTSDPSGGQRLLLSGHSRLAFLEIPMCLNRGGSYFLDLVFDKDSRAQSPSSSHILVDSVGLIPKVQSQQDVCSSQNPPSGVRCVGLFVEPQLCEGLIMSVSAQIHQGAVPCRCNVVGSVSTSCNKVDGSCECKPYVTGHCCDTCAPLTFHFGPEGCKQCDCDPQGALSETCDQSTGQCPCRSEVTGRQCDRCQSGLWGFPQCRPCECNGLSEVCDERSGECVYCRDHATGPQCDRCEDSYYGNPASGQPCQPCLCPDAPDSGRHYAHYCQYDPQSASATCLCQQGHTGVRCERCLPGFYADLTSYGNVCQPCACNNNINMDDSEACDVVTGECLRCLHNTAGSHCHTCKPGYYGNALLQACRECSCERRGTQVVQCPLGSPCFCDSVTGQCACRTGVSGVHCDTCEDGYWNLDAGCQPCSCHPANALSNICDKVSGQCPCRPSFGGRNCDECEDNHFGDPDLQCVSCDCNLEGTQRPSCDPESGDCICRPGVIGIFCDQCAPGHNSVFPACEPCHHCSDVWAESVTDVQRAAKRMATFIPRNQDDLKPGDQRRMISEMVSKLETLSSLKPGSPEKMKQLEDMARKLRRLKDKVDPGQILINPSKLLDNDINTIRMDFQQVVSNLKRTTVEDEPEPEDLSELLERVKNDHKEFAADEARVQDSKNVLEEAMDLRLKASNKLSCCNGGQLLQLSKKVDDLDASDLESQICGQGLEKCSTCGDQSCTAIVPAVHGIVKKAKDAEDALFLLPSKIDSSMDKVKGAKQKAQDVQNQTKMFPKKISEHKNQAEEEKDKTRELLQRVRDYLSDDSLPPEDIEKMSQAVLNIRLPRSPDQIRRMIQDVHDLLKSISKFQDDVQHFGDTRASQQLVEDAGRVRGAVENLPDVEEIRRDVYDAEDAQNKANDGLEAASRDTAAIQEAIKEITQKLDDIDVKMKEDKTVKLQDTIKDLKTKTKESVQKIRDAKDTAQSALELQQESMADVAEVIRKFEALEQMNKNQQSGAEEQLRDILNETKNLKQLLEDKLLLVEEMDQRMNQLIRARDEKQAELGTFLQTLENLQKEIIKRAEEYAACPL